MEDYVTTMLQGMTSEENLHGSELVRVPAPRFIVFYNGTDQQPAQQTLRLSDVDQVRKFAEKR